MGFKGKTVGPGPSPDCPWATQSGAARPESPTEMVKRLASSCGGSMISSKFSLRFTNWLYLKRFFFFQMGRLGLRSELIQKYKIQATLSTRRGWLRLLLWRWRRVHWWVEMPHGQKNHVETEIPRGAKMFFYTFQIRSLRETIMIKLRSTKTMIMMMTMELILSTLLISETDLCLIRDKFWLLNFIFMF